jgi:PhnB protein
MASKVKPIPEGYHAVTPYLVVNGGAGAIEFYKEAFGAKELFRMTRPDGKVGHAEIRIGDSCVMLADEAPEVEARSPKSVGGTPVMLHLYVEDVDRVFSQAVAAGAIVLRQVKDQFYGDRAGGVADPYGHRWYIATHVEDVSPEEVKKRAASAKES